MVSVTLPTSQPPKLTIFLLAELIDDAQTTLRRFSSTIAAAPAVVEAHYVAGEADVVLKLSVADMAEYDRFVESRINPSTLIRRFKTFVSLRTLDEGAKTLAASPG